MPMLAHMANKQHKTACKIQSGDMRNRPPPPPPLLRLRGPLFWAMRRLCISHNAPYLPSKILHKHCFQFLLGRL